MRVYLSTMGNCWGAGASFPERASIPSEALELG